MDNTCSKKQEESLSLSSIWIFLLASLLHFGYSFTHFYPLSFISAVNESVWEHIKIIFFAALFCNLFLYIRKFKGNSGFISGLAPSLASILLTVPFLFYGYSGILGFNLLVIDLLITFISAYIPQSILRRFICSTKSYDSYKVLSILLVVAMIFMFFLFTWYPPSLPLFIH